MRDVLPRIEELGVKRLRSLRGRTQLGVLLEVLAERRERPVEVMAEALGRHPVTVYRWRRGTRPQPRARELLEELLGIARDSEW